MTFSFQPDKPDIHDSQNMFTQFNEKQTENVDYSDHCSVAASSMLALALDCWRDSRDISPHLKLAMCDNTMEGDQNNNL